MKHQRNRVRPNKGKGKVPPKNRRDCPVCEKETTFTYDPGVFHSRCDECGAFRWMC